MRALLGILIVLGTGCVVSGQNSNAEPIYTSADLFTRCSGTGHDRQLCFAYIRGFSDGNRWLLRDAPVATGVVAPQAVCVPNAEPIESAADLFIARFCGRESELETLSPFRALSMSLSQRYPCNRS